MSASSFLRPTSPWPSTRSALDRARRGERVELGAREHLGELDQLHAEAEVGLVGAVAIHGLVPGDLRDRARSLAGHPLGGVEHRLGDGGEHVVLVDEAHLGVELHELVLAVGAEVLVAEAAGDLEVALDAAHHQQLLVELRRLRQGVEAARLLARRHQELACPLRRRGHQHRRLDLGEALALHGAADGAVDVGTHLQVALHPIATEVEVAVAEAYGLVDVGSPGVDREGRRLGDAQDLDGAVAHLDLTGGHGRVDRLARPGPHRAGDADDELATQVVGVVDDALHDARCGRVGRRRRGARRARAGPPPTRRARPPDRCARRGSPRTSDFACSCCGRLRRRPDEHSSLRSDTHRAHDSLASLAHVRWTSFLTRSTTSARATVGLLGGAKVAHDAVPSATSCSPTITATAAPEPPAFFICAFMLRPS